MITDKDIERAKSRGQARMAKYPAAVAARYLEAANRDGNTKLDGPAP